MIFVIFQILRWLGVIGAVSFAVGHEAVASNGDLGLQHWLNIVTWVVGAGAAFFATSGGVLQKLRSLWDYVQRNPFPANGLFRIQQDLARELHKRSDLCPVKRRKLLADLSALCADASIPEPKVT